MSEGKVNEFNGQNRHERRKKVKLEKEIKLEVVKEQISFKEKYKDYRVLIACPSGTMVHADFAMALAGLASYSNSYDIKIMINNFKGAEIAHSRNMMVDTAQTYESKQKLKATHILFIDSDMVFPAHTIRRMIDLMIESKKGTFKEKEGIGEIKILGVTVPKRRFPFCQVAKDLKGERLDIQPDDERGVIEIGEIGTGLLMLDLNLFNKIEQPYFSPFYRNGKDGKPDLNQRVSEDLSLIYKLKELGHKVYCDVKLSLDTSHIGNLRFDYTSKDFFADARELRKQKGQSLLKEHIKKNVKTDEKSK